MVPLAVKEGLLLSPESAGSSIVRIPRGFSGRGWSPPAQRVAVPTMRKKNNVGRMVYSFAVPKGSTTTFRNDAEPVCR
jgi:hypothetical protein